MPKFLYTVVFFTFVPLGVLIYFLGWVSDTSYLNVAIVLLCLFIFLSFLGSIPIFYVFSRKDNLEPEQKNVYRKALRTSAFFALGFTAILFFRGFKLFNLLNISLFSLFYLALAYQMFWGGRKKQQER